jgi:hypothetical protein
MTILTTASFLDGFAVEPLSVNHDVNSFTCKNAEYAEFLQQSARRFQEKGVTKTFVVVEKTTGKIAAYISLVTDAAMVEAEEKQTMALTDFPFETIPALKVAKLAVDSTVGKAYKHLGSSVLAFAVSVAWVCNCDYAACRVGTVDADIEYDENLPAFYAKNGFIPLQNPRYTKRTKTRPMYRDIF